MLGSGPFTPPESSAPGKARARTCGKAHLVELVDVRIDDRALELFHPRACAAGDAGLVLTGADIEPTHL